ncbi:MAG: PorV/PorQ family protein [Candidatus Eisenbacteria bacterium]
MRNDEWDPSNGRRGSVIKSWVTRILIPAAVLGAVTAASAGGLDRVGTSGAQELRIPVGALSVAIGGSTVAMGGGLGNLYYNPASLASTDESQAVVSYSTYLADSKVNYGAVATHLGSQGEIAFHAKVLSVGDITVTTEDAPEGTGDILSPNFSVIGVSYARRMTDRVLLGFTTSFVNEKVADVSASGIAVDLGVQYDTGWRGLRFGFAMKNVGPNMRFDGPNFEERLVLPGGDPSAQPHVVRLQTAEFELPTYLQMGLAYDLPLGENRHVGLYGSFQGNNFSTDEYHLGADFPIGEWLRLRGGFQGQLALSKEERQPEYIHSYSYGAGVQFKLGDRPFHFDWAASSAGEFFDDNQQFSLGLAF